MKNFFIPLVVATLFSPLTAWSAIQGDINNDGRIDTSEAIYALQVAAGLYPGVSTSCLLSGQGDWGTSTAYVECDVVSSGGENYVCNTLHTSSSGVFGDDAANWDLLSLKGDTGATGPKGDTGSGGASIIAKDHAGVVLGKVLSVSDAALKILTSTGHITQFDWGGNPDVTYTYFFGANCTGTTFKNATYQYPTNNIHWAYLPSNIGVPVPYTLSALQGAKTPVSRTKESTNGTCEAYTTERTNTYTLTQTTYTAIGLPNTITGPIVVEDQ